MKQRIINILKAHNVEVTNTYCLEQYTIDGELHCEWIALDSFACIKDVYAWLGY